MPWTMEKKIFCVRTYHESLSRLLKQDTEGSSISIHFQTGDKFSSWSKTLKIIALVKIIGQRIPHHLGLQ